MHTDTHKYTYTHTHIHAHTCKKWRKRLEREGQWRSSRKSQPCFMTWSGLNHRQQQQQQSPDVPTLAFASRVLKGSLVSFQRQRFPECPRLHSTNRHTWAVQSTEPILILLSRSSMRPLLIACRILSIVFSFMHLERVRLRLLVSEPESHICL